MGVPVTAGVVPVAGTLAAQPPRKEKPRASAARAAVTKHTPAARMIAFRLSIGTPGSPCNGRRKKFGRGVCADGSPRPVPLVSWALRSGIGRNVPAFTYEKQGFRCKGGLIQPLP